MLDAWAMAVKRLEALLGSGGHSGTRCHIEDLIAEVMRLVEWGGHGWVRTSDPSNVRRSVVATCSVSFHQDGRRP